MTPAGGDDRRTVARFYLATAALFTTHEIDAAYWHEWTMFALPGGVDLFLILNLVLVAVVIHGYAQVRLWVPRAAVYSYFMAACGLAAGIIHGGFLAHGHPAFRLPVSLAVLLAGVVVSLLQVRATLRATATGPAT